MPKRATPYEATVKKREERAAKRGIRISHLDLHRAPGHPRGCRCYDCMFPPVDMAYRPRERKAHA